MAITSASAEWAPVVIAIEVEPNRGGQVPPLHPVVDRHRIQDPPFARTVKIQSRTPAVRDPAAGRSKRRMLNPARSARVRLVEPLEQRLCHLTERRFVAHVLVADPVDSGRPRRESVVPG